ncbi:MAG TPA: hypothetical protein PLE92_12735, partial [Lentisphaeria bacterium]|nr:hypothetical protein [Lentisphaeria bacterium]
VDDGLWTEVDISGEWTWTEVDLNGQWNFRHVFYVSFRMHAAKGDYQLLTAYPPMANSAA